MSPLCRRNKLRNAKDRTVSCTYTEKGSKTPVTTDSPFGWLCSWPQRLLHIQVIITTADLFKSTSSITYHCSNDHYLGGYKVPRLLSRGTQIFVDRIHKYNMQFSFNFILTHNSWTLPFENFYKRSLNYFINKQKIWWLQHICNSTSKFKWMFIVTLILLSRKYITT